MTKTLSEQQIEQAALGWFEALGFDVRKGADISPGAGAPLRESHEHVIMEPRLRAALRRINRHLPEDAVEQAVRIVARPPEPALFQNTRWFHRLLTDGIDVEYRTPDGETRGDKAWLADFSSPGANDLMAQAIEELIGLAREIREAVNRGEEFGLSDEELAFYDALADNQSAREVIQDETLRLIARELSERIKAKASLDWTQRDAVRADMRRTVRRLLAKHGYPPDAQEAATQLVIRQAELMAESVVD